MSLAFLQRNMASSDISFNDIILQCRLYELANKLSITIEQNEEIIHELSRSNVYSSIMLEQNNKLIQHAEQAAVNSAIAAEASQRAARNTERMSDIESYYYFKNS